MHLQSPMQQDVFADQSKRKTLNFITYNDSNDGRNHDLQTRQLVRKQARKASQLTGKSSKGRDPTRSLKVSRLVSRRVPLLRGVQVVSHNSRHPGSFYSRRARVLPFCLVCEKYADPSIIGLQESQGRFRLQKDTSLVPYVKKENGIETLLSPFSSTIQSLGEDVSILGIKLLETLPTLTNNLCRLLRS